MRLGLRLGPHRWPRCQQRLIEGFTSIFAWDTNEEDDCYDDGGDWYEEDDFDEECDWYGVFDFSVPGEELHSMNGPFLAPNGDLVFR